MKIQNNDTKDEGLKGNEKIEEAISALQQEASQELLAHTLTVIRRRMKEEGQLILAVEPSVAEELKIQAVKTADGKKWWSAFTSFEEELKGSDRVMSTFLTAIEPLFQSAVQVNEIEGIILNPWNRTILSKKARATDAVVKGWPSVMRCAYLERRSTTVRITDFPPTLGSPWMKSSEISVQTWDDSSRGCCRPTGCSVSILFCWHVGQERTQPWTSVRSPGMKNFERSRWRVFCTPSCPAASARSSAWEHKSPWSGM